MKKFSRNIKLICLLFVLLSNLESKSQTYSLYNIFSATENGVVPSPGGTPTGTKVLADNATWISPLGITATTPAAVSTSGSTLTILNTAAYWNANLLQGRTVNSSKTPTDQQVLTWVSANSDWEPTTQLSASNWLITGNSNTTSSNILGTTIDVPMNIASNNTTMLQVGKRQTLGLYDSSTTGLYPYNQANNSVAYVTGGSSGVSALQFQADAASFYKPVFFTDADGNFTMRGSAAGTDFFELGSSGTSNNGQLTFTIGDDGNEPMVFRKYNYSPSGYVEMMRLQGTGLTNAVRAGINVSGSTPNSTLQVVGSLSLPITTITANTTLDETYYTVILKNNYTITLPAANTCTGRIYIIKRIINTGTSTISSYINSTGTATTAISQGVTQLQSDGTNWQQIN